MPEDEDEAEQPNVAVRPAIEAEKSVPPSPNPYLREQMVNAAMSGDPGQILGALEAVGVLPKEQVEALKEAAKREQEKLATFALQIAHNTEGIRVMAHAMDIFQKGVGNDLRQTDRKVELIRRALAKISDFRRAYEQAVAHLEAQEKAEAERAEVAAKSANSSKVTTSPPPAKSP